MVKSYVIKWLKNLMKTVKDKVVIIICAKNQREYINNIVLNINKNIKVYIFDKTKFDISIYKDNSEDQCIFIMLDYTDTLKYRKFLLDEQLIENYHFFCLYSEFFTDYKHLRNSQIDFIISCNERFDFSDKVILEIGSGDGEVANAITKLYSPKKYIATDIKKWKYKKHENLINKEYISNLEYIYSSIENLKLPECYFDLIISISTFEHISDVKGTMQKVHKLLKYNGHFCAYFGPLWSSFVGHHYNYWIPKYKGLIPPWGHLYFNKDMFINHMSKKVSDSECLKIYSKVYESDYINRLSRRDFYKIVYESEFNVVEIKDEIKIPSEMTFFDILILRNCHKKLKKYTFKDLITYKILMVLKK